MAPDKKNVTDFSLFTNYPLHLSFYQGTGTLTLETQETFTCTFEAGQMKKGDIFLICKNLEPVFPSILFATAKHPEVSHFQGRTNEGYHLFSREKIIIAGHISATEVTCWLRTLVVEMRKDREPYQVHYGLTNVLLRSTFPLRLEHAGTLLELLVKPIENYQNSVDYISCLN